MRSPASTTRTGEWLEGAESRSCPKTNPASRRGPRLPRSRTKISRMATSPRRNAIAMATTINRYEPLLDKTLAEIFTLDEPDAFDIEQMRAPASSRQRHRQLRGDQQRYHDHRNRHGADPVQPHRR